MAGLFVPNLTPEQIANARKWIAALRSGKYQQGRGALRVAVTGWTTRWCCLGVGGDVVHPDIVDSWRAFLSDEDTVALGLSDGEGSYSFGEDSLTALNDIMHATFSQIADVIEAELALVTEVTA